MATLELSDLRNGYIEVVEFVLQHGTKTAPRGQGTTEVLDLVLIVHDPTDVLPVGVGRGLNLKIAAAEAIQLVAERSVPELMLRASPNFNQFTEDDGTFWGAYGQRIGQQVQAVEHKLHMDPDTRQAVITLWDPTKDNLSGKRDYPCTTMLQFLIRDGKLVMHTTMRSNDVWWGLAYDAFQFTQLQLTLARCLGIEAGPYHHHAVSMHVYDRDLSAIDGLHRDERRPAARPAGIGLVGHDFLECRRRARALIDGAAVPAASTSEWWYREQLATIR